MACRQLFLPIPALISRQKWNNAEPRNEHQVGVAGLVADQIFVTRFLEVGVNHSSHPLYLVSVPIFCAGNICVGMEEGEPRLLSKVWTLPAHLELGPALLLVLLRRFGVRKFMLFVVGVKKVIDDGAGLRLVNIIHSIEI